MQHAVVCKYSTFLKLMREVLKHVPFECCIQLMIGGLKTVNLAWVNKNAMIGYTWLFAYDSARRYRGWMNAAPAGYHGVAIRRCVLSRHRLIHPYIGFYDWEIMVIFHSAICLYMPCIGVNIWENSVTCPHFITFTLCVVSYNNYFRLLIPKDQ